MSCVASSPNGLGPNPVTISDFIQMIWDQRPPVLVMLTHLVEKGKVKPNLRNPCPNICICKFVERRIK